MFVINSDKIGPRMAEKSKSESNIASIAAILVTVASLFAAVSWISSGKAGGEESDHKTAALGLMILRLESSTEASTARVQAQTYLTQAGMYYAYAEKEDNEDVKRYLENLGDTSLVMSNFYIVVAENAENRAQSYYDDYVGALDAAEVFGRNADYRSTGALLFNMSAIVASCGVILKRREILFVFVPIFAFGMGYLILSLV